MLIYLALHLKERVTINQLSSTYKVSRHHIRSVVHHLAKLGYIESTQGKGGGVTLALKSAQISIREIVENTENDFYIVEYFSREDHTCPIEPLCILKQALSEASKSFLRTLEGYTIEDLIKNKKTQLKTLLEMV